MGDNDNRAAAVVGFVIGFLVVGILGIIPWDHPQMTGSRRFNQPWQWHMNSAGNWYVLVLFAGLVGVLIGVIVYAIKRWK